MRPAGLIVRAAALLMPLPLVLFLACKPAETAASRELEAIDQEIDSNKARMQEVGPGNDEYQRLWDKNLELQTRRTNIVQAADKTRQSQP